LRWAASGQSHSTAGATPRRHREAQTHTIPPPRRIGGTQRYDFILDNVANHSLSDCRRALTPKGTLLPDSGGEHWGGRWIGGGGRVIKALVLSLFVRQQGHPSVSFATNEDLVYLKQLIEAGKLTPVIDRTYPLSETPEAIDYLGE
jgi:NADPH:quinone reductase-like Zn-dependent oxidoreductase